MRLQRGITSFFTWNERGPIAEFTFREFKELVYGLATAVPFAVLELAPRGVTPNFHTALISYETQTLAILGHSTYPIVAIAEPLQPFSQQLIFVDCPQITSTLASLFPNVKIASCAELAQDVSNVDQSNLDKCEIEQIAHWKPKTVGEIIFNWWD